MVKEQWPYQVIGINQVARKSAAGIRRILFQLATGGGKTVCFAGLVKRYLDKNPGKKVVIFVHREELLRQAYKTLFSWYDIVSIPVTADTSYFPNGKVYAAMVETAYNRLKNNPNYFGDVGLVIIDECHIGNFKKLYSYFPDALTVGFTATPIAASKKDPLKNYFDDIVCAVDIPNLIEFWRQDHAKGLVPNRTIDIAGINRRELAIKNGEFDDRKMGATYSSVRHVQNCLKAYKDHCSGKKTIIFNCNVEHSKKVADTFKAFGLPCRHLDGEMENERKPYIEWFRQTPGAILCNVGILTTGFDEPSIEAVIVNKSTMSLPLWLQMTGRGARPHPGKEQFLIIDLGGNGLVHGDWSEARNWVDLFKNPPEPNATGEAPVKKCGNCSTLIHASQIICPHCGCENKKKILYDASRISTRDFAGRKPPDIYVADLVKANIGKSEYRVLHQIKFKIVNHVKYKWRMNSLDDNTAMHILSLYQFNVEEWCAIVGKKWNTFHKRISQEWMFQELKKEFNWEPTNVPVNT